MASSIDITKPTTGSPTTSSVRDNFNAAKSEIEALQSDKANIAGPALTGTTTAVNLTVSGTLNASGTFTVSAIDGAVIGGVTPAAATFTTITGSGDLAINTDTLFVDVSAGNAGIGTTSPESKLHVEGYGGDASDVCSFRSGPSAAALHVTGYSNTAQNRVYLSHNVYRDSATAYQYDNAAYGSSYINFNDGFMAFGASAANAGTPVAPTERMRITSAGEVQIAGTTDRGAFNLQCNGTGVWGQGAYTNGSDARWKDNVQPINENALDLVDQLRPVSYQYNELSGAQDTNTTHVGFIAQEVENVLAGVPWLEGVVSENDEGFKSMAYQYLVPVLVKAIQELTQRVAELENK